MAEISSMRNFKRTGGAGAGAVGTDSVDRAGGAIVGQSQDEAIGNTFGQLTKEERKQYGVKDNEMTYAARDPGVWQRVEGKNRVTELARQYGYARVIEDAEGRPVMDGTDNVMVALPREPWDNRNKLMQEELQKQYADLQETRHGDDVYLETEQSNAALDTEMPFTLGDKQLLRQIAAQNRRNNRATGIMGAGSPTRGMSLAKAESMYTKEQIEAEERQHAGTTSHLPMTPERWRDMVKSMDPTAKAQRGAQFGFSDTGFARNPNSPLAQAQARNRPAAR